MLRQQLVPGKRLGNTCLMARMSLSLALWRPRDSHERQLKQMIATLAPHYTMVGLPRLRRLVDHARLLHREDISGSVVECGTWRGGGLALIDWTFRSLGHERLLWGFDSFEGLPAPGIHDPREAHGIYYPGFCAASEQHVRDALIAVGGDPLRLMTVKGWLSDTLPATDTGPIALLNIDVDWYDSVTTSLHELYPRVMPGGIVNFDDYGRWSGCDRAVHDFFDEHGWSRGILCRTGRHGAWIRKGSV